MQRMSILKIALWVSALFLASSQMAQANWSDSSQRMMLQGGITQEATLPPPQAEPVALKVSQPGGRGFLGLELKIQSRSNPLVLTVFSGSPAEQVGIVPGDELLASQGEQLFGRSASEVDWALPDGIGEPVVLLVRHGRQLRTVRLRVAAVQG